MPTICHVWIKVQRNCLSRKPEVLWQTAYTNQYLWHNSEQALGVNYSSFPYSATMTNARFRWSLKQGFHTAVHGTETTEIDCRCSKQPWQMNVPSINIWKVNKGNKSVQRMGKKNSWIKVFGDVWPGHSRALTVLEAAIIIIHCFWLLYFITWTHRQSTLCCSVHLTRRWKKKCGIFLLFSCLVCLGEPPRFLKQDISV